MDDQSDLNSAVQQMDEDNPEPGPELEASTTVEETPVENVTEAVPPHHDTSMEVDDAAFEDALESISEEVPDTGGVEDAPKVTTAEDVDKLDMSTDDPEQVKSPESHEEETETNKDEGEQPHAMEIHDVPEHDTDTEDPNATVAPSEKSIDVTLLNSSAIDPFDTVKHTSTNEDSVVEKDTSDIHEATAGESEHEQTNDDVDTTGAQDDDNNSPVAEDLEERDKDNDDLDKDDADKEDETSQQKETEEEADGKSCLPLCSTFI